MIYLDHMTSTPVDPEVRDAMLPWLAAAAAGNPHSEHPAGWRAAEAVEAARAEVAALIGARPSEILFTSGATEANNLALMGTVTAPRRLLFSAIEHPSVLEPAAELAERGVEIEMLPVDAEGLVGLDRLEESLAKGPALVAVMAANNEIGTLQPLARIAALCKAHDALFLTDAVQALSTQAIDVAASGIDMLSLSGHKLYGPAGIGALYLRDGLDIAPLTFGGGQQGGRRPGTLPVALAVALGAACRLARARRAEDGRRIGALRERLFAALLSGAPDLRRNGPAESAVPGCLNVSVPGLDAADFLLDVPDLAISTGSACSALSGVPSHVVRAIGLSAEEAHASLRFGLGRGTTEEEVDEAAARIIAGLRNQSRRR